MAVNSATLDDNRRQPENQTVTPVHCNELSPQYSSATNSRHQQNCDNRRLDDENVATIRSAALCANDGQQPATNTSDPVASMLNDDLGDDPYAELQSYLEKVKVSTTHFVFVIRPHFVTILHHGTIHETILFKERFKVFLCACSSCARLVDEIVDIFSWYTFRRGSFILPLI